MIGAVGPEILVAAAAQAAAQSEDGMGLGNGPVQARGLEACDDAAAAGLDDSRVDAQTQLAELGIGHAAAVVGAVVGAAGRLGAVLSGRAQAGQQEIDAPLLEIVVAGVGQRAMPIRELQRRFPIIRLGSK